MKTIRVLCLSVFMLATMAAVADGDLKDGIYKNYTVCSQYSDVSQNFDFSKVRHRSDAADRKVVKYQFTPGDFFKVKLELPKAAKSKPETAIYQVIGKHNKNWLLLRRDSNDIEKSVVVYLSDDGKGGKTCRQHTASGSDQPDYDRLYGMFLPPLPNVAIGPGDSWSVVYKNIKQTILEPNHGLRYEWMGGPELEVTVTKMDEERITIMATSRLQLKLGYPKANEHLLVEEALRNSFVTMKLDDASKLDAKATKYELHLNCSRKTSQCDQAETTPLIYKLTSEPLPVNPSEK
jgi:hypothetical protein